MEWTLCPFCLAGADAVLGKGDRQRTLNPVFPRVPTGYSASTEGDYKYYVFGKEMFMVLLKNFKEVTFRMTVFMIVHVVAIIFDYTKGGSAHYREQQRKKKEGRKKVKRSETGW